MHVTQEGPDSLSRYCRVQAIVHGEAILKKIARSFVMSLQQVVCPVIVGGVDTHKDLHVAAAVNEQDQELRSHTGGSRGPFKRN